jgi:hypothetical protein
MHPPLGQRAIPKRPPFRHCGPDPGRLDRFESNAAATVRLDFDDVGFAGAVAPGVTNSRVAQAVERLDGLLGHRQLRVPLVDEARRVAIASHLGLVAIPGTAFPDDDGAHSILIDRYPFDSV